MRIYIGNLSKMTTSRHLADLFQSYGAVRTSRIVSDEKTGHSLGFGFVEMEPKCAKRAIEKLHRFLFMNFYLEVNEVC
jgi:RNA recognition motif-containing protein